MLFIQPSAGPQPLVQILDQAQRTVDVNVYMLTDQRVLTALRSAAGRGVRVRVLLDAHPYGVSPWRVTQEIGAVRATGAVVRMPPSRFRFDHAKYLCADQVCIIGTANLTYAAFSRNREYQEATAQPTVVRAVREVFAADWAGHAVPSDARRWLVLSPGAAPVLARLLDQPGTVCVETEEMGDDPAIGNAMLRDGPRLHLILPSRVSSSQINNVNRLAQGGVLVRQMPARRYMHAKLIAGSQWVFTGSQNFTATSLDRNREMGVVLGQPDAGLAATQCARDWAAATPWRGGAPAPAGWRGLLRHRLLRHLLFRHL